MRKIFLLLFSTSLLIAGCNQEIARESVWEQSTLYKIVKTKQLRICTNPGYEPFEMRNKNNDIIGFDIDIARMMAKAMDAELEIVPISFDAIIPALLTDKCDIIMSGMTISPERNLQVNFPHAYLYIGQTLLVNKKLANEIKSYEDLNDPKYTIVTRLGVTGSFVAKEKIPHATLKLYESETEAFLEVVNDRADAFIFDFPLCASFMVDYGEHLIFLDEPFTYEPLGMAIRKGDPDFINWIDNFMTQLKGDGQYDTVYKYWFESNDWKKAVR